MDPARILQIITNSTWMGEYNTIFTILFVYQVPTHSLFLCSFLSTIFLPNFFSRLFMYIFFLPGFYIILLFFYVLFLLLFSYHLFFFPFFQSFVFTRFLNTSFPFSCSFLSTIDSIHFFSPFFMSIFSTDSYISLYFLFHEYGAEMILT